MNKSLLYTHAVYWWELFSRILSTSCQQPLLVFEVSFMLSLIPSTRCMSIKIRKHTEAACRVKFIAGFWRVNNHKKNTINILPTFHQHWHFHPHVNSQLAEGKQKTLTYQYKQLCISQYGYTMQLSQNIRSLGGKISHIWSYGCASFVSETYSTRACTK